ncbi:heme ABC transporter ATP-binding protein [Corynebacterium sp. MSK039]|uniref:heme ABC transporter ATP-binding protein n=1 Tax=Corynebacterium sp. MSK039 TaxID=3050193 RepID=UPI00254B63C9|nr:heme ABC transporter ATP-binding protein [Corynebacterium sp. MSK039]MDK8791515.1 heme ABC transporter ATP-binding protein [Corynebacterium sp. MSK039]
MLSVDNLTVTVGERTLVDSVSFTAKPGEVTGLIGPNGAGKSTVLAAVAGDMDYTGEISVGGLSPKAPPLDLARTRAVMLQDVAVSFEFLVRDVVAMGRRPWRGTPHADLDEQLIDAALEAADVAHLAGRDISTLSGGERARVAFARVLAQNTPIVLLDEPTAALDIRHQEQLLGTVKSLAREAGVAALVVLHDLNAAASYCDHIVCVSCGGLAAQGRVAEVFTDHTLSEVYGWPISVNGLQVQPQRATPTINPLFSHQLEEFHA